MIILNKERRLRASFNMGAKLEVYYGVGMWKPYNGVGFPLKDINDIRIDKSVQYVVLDSVRKGLTYCIFPSEVLSKFIKPYYVGTFDKCFDWVLANTKWDRKTERLFEKTYINLGKNTKITPYWVVYKDDCSDFWHSIMEHNFDCIKYKPGVEMVYKGSKEKCEKKVERHNFKFYAKHKDDDCAVYKDEIGIYHFENIHNPIADEHYKRVYTGSYKECKAFIAGATVSLPKDWFVIIDECGKYEILCGEHEPNTLVIYKGSSQECFDFTKRFRSWEKYLANFVRVGKNNILVDISELTIRHLKILARHTSGIEIDYKDAKNCPIISLLIKHNFISIDC